MILKYPGVAGKPIVLAVVDCLMTRKRFLVPMLLDTGADETCFPATFAAFFGHNNHHPSVLKKKCRGVGGDSVAYVHSVQLSLLHPDKSSPSKPHVAWTAPAKKATFIENWIADLVCWEWTSFPNGKRWLSGRKRPALPS